MKKVTCILVNALLAVSLVACGQKAPEKKKYSITVAGDYKNFEALEAEFNKYNETHPDIEFEYVPIDDYKNNIASVLESDEKPNIFFNYTWMANNTKYAPIFEHTENLADPELEFDLTCIRPGLIKQDEGVVSMVPVFSRTYGMLVNHDLFKEEGLDIPTTWEELQTVCKAFKEKGYTSPIMGYTKDSSSCLMNTVAYPMFVAALANNPEALEKANNLDPSAGEYMRDALETVDHIMKNEYVDLTECNKMEKNYEPVIFRFFDGDVPMMVCAGDTVSGTKKRETQYAPFVNSPFSYSFYPIPETELGGYFIDSPSIEFSVNKNCDNLDLTNDFMRFLLSSEELNAMASIKCLVSPTNEMPLGSLYAPFASVPSERTFSPEMLGINDSLSAQIRLAAYKVGKGELTIDEAIAQYGTLK